MEATIVVFMALSTLGSYNSNAFKKFYKYGLKVETYIPIILTLKKIQVKKINT
jgi:hypothetical protein